MFHSISLYPQHYSVNACLCHFVLCLRLGSRHWNPTAFSQPARPNTDTKWCSKRGRRENDRDKKKTVKWRRNLALDINRTAIRRPIHILCALVDYITFWQKPAYIRTSSLFFLFFISFFLSMFHHTVFFSPSSSSSSSSSCVWFDFSSRHHKKIAFIFLLMRREYFEWRTHHRQIIPLYAHKRIPKIHFNCTTLLHIFVVDKYSRTTCQHTYAYPNEHIQPYEKKMYWKCVNANRKLGKKCNDCIKPQLSKKKNMHLKPDTHMFTVFIQISIARGESRLQEITNYTMILCIYDFQTLYRVILSKMRPSEGDTLNFHLLIITASHSIFVYS